jgi:hypothetical protein
VSEAADMGSERKEEKMSDLAQNFKKGIFLIAMLLSLVATFQVYFSIENIIEIWFEYQYAPIFRAAYNFLVLVVSLYIIRLYIIKR